MACTRFCEAPGVPTVGGTKDPDIDAISSLAPDLVLLDAEENRIEDRDALLDTGLEVHATRIRSLEDVSLQLGIVADRLGHSWTPPRVDIQPDRGLRAFVPIWKRPWMALGSPTYGSSILHAIGIGNVFSERGAYPEVTLDAAVDARCNLVVAPDEPYPFAERHRELLETVAPTVFVDGRDLLWWGARTPLALERLSAALRGIDAG